MKRPCKKHVSRQGGSIGWAASGNDKPKLMKPMRKTLLNSELMMDQIKLLSYSEKDTYDFWIKEIEES